MSGKNAALKTPLRFEPGEKWNYGIGVDFVGKGVEAVSGKKLGVVMKENLFEPLGMSDMAFKLTASMRLAKVHQRGDADELKPLMDFEIEQPVGRNKRSALRRTPASVAQHRYGRRVAVPYSEKPSRTPS